MRLALPFIFSFTAIITSIYLPLVEGRHRKYNTKAARIDDPNIYNVHIVPHSHDDVGWKKTIDQYYYGSNGTEAIGAVQYILQTTLQALLQNPDRIFTFVEQGFFVRFFNELDDTTQDTIRQLVQEKRLVFVNGGYTMPDEAGPSYVELLSDICVGHRYISEFFGPEYIPKIQAQYDPFGHTAFFGSVLGSMLAGYEGIFWGRISYDDKNIRSKTEGLEWIWSPSPTLGNKGATFAGTLPNGYNPPNAITFDQRHCYTSNATNCNTFIQDDPNLEDYNVDILMAEAVEQIKSMYFGGGYKGNDAFITAGADFAYENSYETFINYDKLIHYINLNTSIHGINMFYSTPNNYMQAKLSYTNITFPNRTADIVPYSSDQHAYWTGYFTSRPALKGYVRESTNVLQVARQLQVYTQGVSMLNTSDPLYILETGHAISSHHDAISGTEKQHVAYDYARRIAVGRLSVDAFTSSAFEKLTGYTVPPSIASLSFATCDLLNATICPALENGTASIVLVYNSQGQPLMNAPIKVSVGNGGNSKLTWDVYDMNGNVIVSQLYPLSTADISLRATYYKVPFPNKNNSKSVSWLSFLANLPPAGYSTYFLVPSSASTDETLDSSPTMPTKSNLRKLQNDQILSNNLVSVTISSTTGMLSHFTDKINNIDIPLTQSWSYYIAAIGNNDPCAGCTHASGAYIFRPNGSVPLPVTGDISNVEIITGPIVNEARITVTPWLTQVIRLWANQSFVESEWTVGPIPVDDNIGKEIVTQYSIPSWSNAAQQWTTDSNCRDILIRTKDKRDWTPYTVTEPISSNYYPVNCLMQIWDDTTNNYLSIATDRTQGATGMYNSTSEFMVHRRLLLDDNFGVMEALNEPGLDWTGKGLMVRGIHRLGINSASATPLVAKTLQQNLFFQPRLFFSPLINNLTPQQWITQYRSNYQSIITSSLPPNIHLLTVQAWDNNSLLLRLAHLYDIHDANIGGPSNLVNNVTVNIGSIFNSSTSGFTIISVTEMTAPGSKPLSSLTPVKYYVDNDPTNPIIMPQIPTPPQGNDFTITINPLEIRTFICTIQTN